jgi:hypothetical protein
MFVAARAQGWCILLLCQCWIKLITRGPEKLSLLVQRGTLSGLASFVHDASKYAFFPSKLDRADDDDNAASD